MYMFHRCTDRRKYVGFHRIILIHAHNFNYIGKMLLPKMYNQASLASSSFGVSDGGKISGDKDKGNARRTTNIEYEHWAYTQTTKIRLTVHITHIGKEIQTVWKTDKAKPKTKRQVDGVGWLVSWLPGWFYALCGSVCVIWGKNR